MLTVMYRLAVFARLGVVFFMKAICHNAFETIPFSHPNKENALAIFFKDLPVYSYTNGH